MKIELRVLTYLLTGKIELTPEEIEREIRMKQLANREELEKVKTRRQEREAERAAREEEMAREQRSKEAQQFQEWQKHEDQFHLEQARLRSKFVSRYARVAVCLSLQILILFISGRKSKAH